MNRTPLLILNAVAALLTVAAAWFAVNAPELARQPTRDLTLASPEPDRPPLPPAPASRSVDAPAAGAPPTLTFVAKRSDPPSGGAARGAAPGARTVLAPPMTPGASMEHGLEELRRPDRREPLAMAVAQPTIDQFYGPHFLPRSARRSDRGEAVGDGDPGLAPRRAPIPRKRPDPPEKAVAAAETAEPETSEGAEASASASASTAASAPAPERPARSELSDRASSRVAAAARSTPGPDFQPVEGMILLGVFKGRQGERALVRTQTGDVKTVTPGDEIEGWRVASIGETTLQLRRASQTRLLELPEDQQ